MHAWEAIQNSVDYIEAHVSEDITLETLANVASLSPYYFQRLFARLVKKPVIEYVKLRRLARACEALNNKEKRIIDIALDNGFSNHANFTRAFKEAYGITPEIYRESPVILNQFIKPDLLLQYVMIDENVPLITDGIVLEVTRKVLDKPRTIIGISGDVPIKELAGGKTTSVSAAGAIWDDFHRQKSSILHLLAKRNEYGILYLGPAREGCCIYLAGAEANENGSAEGFSSFTLPCGEYVVCCFEARNFAELIGSAVFKASSFMEGWMKKHNLTCDYFAAEVYYDVEPDTSYMEQWLPINLSGKPDGKNTEKCVTITSNP